MLCFTGALYIDDSNIVLKGETVFANNTAVYHGGTTLKYTIRFNPCNRKKLFPKKYFGKMPRKID